MKYYGKELILDLHECDPKTFNRKSLKKYFVGICDEINMQRCKLTWWDDVGVAKEEQQTEPHLKGTSAVQFIMTSSIVIHTLDLMGNVYVNIFSCKDFDIFDAELFTQMWFRGKVVTKTVVYRK